MWHSLRKSVQAIDPLIRTSVVFSCLLHLFILVISFVIHFLKPAQRISICRNAMITKEVTIIIDPHAPVTGVVMRTTAPQSNTATHTKIETQKPLTTLVSAPSARTKSSKKAAQKQKPKSKAKAAQKKPEPKKLKPVKTASEKPKVAPPIVEPEKKVVEKTEVLLSTTSELQAPSVPAYIDGPIMIARNASDAAALTVQLEVQEELLRVWQPPVGIEEGISCQIKIVLDSNGMVQTLEVLKPSGMLLFDVSARAAVQQAVWPCAVWGTTLELCLQ